LETVEALPRGKAPRFAGHSVGGLIDFLLPSHIAALAVAMLLYASDRVAPFAFAATVAIASKALFRTHTDGLRRHFMNPSNLGITVTLLCFRWVGLAPPYQFTERLTVAESWILPAIVLCSGTFINHRFTGRLPLVISWLTGFALQAGLRSAFLGERLWAALAPIMITDPATSPRSVRNQVAFGASAALVYGGLVSLHVVYGMFLSLTIVCACRGFSMAIPIRVSGSGPQQASGSERPSFDRGQSEGVSTEDQRAAMMRCSIGVGSAKGLSTARARMRALFLTDMSRASGRKV
jgi:hypothetical protein